MVYETRWEFIKPHVQNKRVLDIGPAELVGTVNQEKLDRWMHRRIAEIAEHVVGLEKNPEQVTALGRMGYDIREGDAENFNLGEKFDVVIAGELIEHLSNPGGFFNCVGEHLVEGGKLLLTTPNRYNVLSISSVVKSGKVPAYQKEIAKHVLYFDEDALTSLLQRYGFREIQVDYCKWVGASNKRWREKWLIDLISRCRPALLPVLLAIARK